MNHAISGSCDDEALPALSKSIPHLASESSEVLRCAMPQEMALRIREGIQMNCESAYSALLRRHRERKRGVVRLGAIDSRLMELCSEWKTTTELAVATGLSKSTLRYHIAGLRKAKQLKVKLVRHGEWSMRRKA